MNPLGMFGNKDTDYCAALADAMELLSVSDAVIFCPGWENSCGCRAEKAFAMQQGIKVMYLQDFPEAMRHLSDEAVKEDLAQALKAEIVRQSKGIKASCCITTAQTKGGRVDYGDGIDR